MCGVLDAYWRADGARIVTPRRKSVTSILGKDAGLLDDLGDFGYKIAPGKQLLGNYWEAAICGLYGGEQYPGKMHLGLVSLFPDVIDRSRRTMAEVKAARFGKDLTVSHRQLLARLSVQAAMPDWTVRYFVCRHGYEDTMTFKGSAEELATYIGATPGYLLELPLSLVTQGCRTQHPHLRQSRHPKYPDATVWRQALVDRLVTEPAQAIAELDLDPERYARSVRRSRRISVDGAHLPPLYVVSLTDRDRTSWVRNLSNGLPKLWFQQRDEETGRRPADDEVSFAVTSTVDDLHLPF